MDNVTLVKNEFRNCLDLSSAPIGLRTYQGKHVTLAFNSKWKYEQSFAAVRVLQNTPNLNILRCFAEQGWQLYQDL